MDRMQDRYDVSLLFIDNASSDATVSGIEELMGRRSGVYLICLSSNVGYQRSVGCALAHAWGDLMVVIDVDCEDPPEMIVDFAREHEKGHDIVYGRRVDRDENYVIKLIRKLFYRVTKIVADDDIILDMAEFCLITAEVRDAVISDNSSFPFIRASIARVGFRRCGLSYRRQKRIAGETHYNFISMTRFAVAGILSASTFFLRLPLYSLPLYFLVLIALAAADIVTGARWPATLMALTSFAYIGGSVAFIAVYVARTYRNALGHPNYVIDTRRTILPPGGQRRDSVEFNPPREEKT